MKIYFKILLTIFGLIFLLNTAVSSSFDNYTKSITTPNLFLYSNNNNDSTSILDSLSIILKKGRLIGPYYYIQDVGGKVDLKFNYSINVSRSLISAYEICNDRRSITTASKDLLISIWKNEKNKTTLKKHKNSILSVATTNNRKFLISGGKDNIVIIWDIDKGKAIRKIKNVFNTEVRKILISKNDSSFYCIGDENRIKKFSIYSGKSINGLLPHESELCYIGYSDDKAILLTGDITGNIRVWDANSEKLIKSIITENRISDIQIAHNNKSLVCISSDGVLLIYDIKNFNLVRKQEIQTFANPKIGIFNKYIIVPLKDRTLSVLNYENTDIQIIDPEINGLSSFYADPENNQITLIMNNGMLLFYDIILPEYSPYANDIIDDLLLSSDTIAVIKAKMRLYTELIISSKKILDPINNGAEILPSIDELNKAIDNIDYALKLIDNEAPIFKKDKYLKYLLEAYVAIIKYDKEKYLEAEENMKFVAEQVPFAAYPHNTLSILYSRQDKIEEAKNSAKIAISNAPRWTEPHHNLGQIYHKENNYEQAINEYEKIITKDPDNTKGYNDLGVIYNELGSFSKSEEYFKNSLRIDSLNPSTYLNFGSLQMQRGRFKDAKKLFEMGIDIDSCYEGSKLSLGKFYHALYLRKPVTEYLEKAYSLILKATHTNPYNPDCHIELMKLLMTMVDSQNPIIEDLLNNSIERKHSNLDLNVWDNILELSNSALKLDSSKTDAYEGVAYVAIRKQNSPYIDSIFKKVINRNPEKPENYYRYGKHLVTQGRIEDAILLFKSAISKDNKYLIAYLDLWDAYVDQEMKEELNLLFKQSIKAFPDCPIFHYRKALLKVGVDKREISAATKLDEGFYYAKEVLYNADFEENNRSNEKIEDQLFQDDFVRIKKIDKHHILVKQDDWFGMINIAGDFVLPFDYNRIFVVNDTLLLAIKGDQFFSSSNKLFWFNLKGKSVLSPQEYRRAEIINNGYGKINDLYIAVEKNGKHGCINMYGEQIIPVNFDVLRHFSNGNKMIGVGKKSYNSFNWGAYNFNSRCIVPLEYDRVDEGTIGGRSCCVCIKEGQKNKWVDYTGREH